MIKQKQQMHHQLKFLKKRQKNRLKNLNLKQSRKVKFKRQIKMIQINLISPRYQIKDIMADFQQKILIKSSIQQKELHKDLNLHF